MPTTGKRATRNQKTVPGQTRRGCEEAEFNSGSRTIRRQSVECGFGESQIAKMKPSSVKGDANNGTIEAARVFHETCLLHSQPRSLPHLTNKLTMEICRMLKIISKLQEENTIVREIRELSKKQVNQNRPVVKSSAKTQMH